MIAVRKGQDRGHANHGWLDTYHTFSFADYHDPNFMGFRALRVLNEDRVAPGQGFGEHPHRDMEIVTCVLEGALEHRDSMGNGSVLHPGDFQRMTAGTGMRHSEFNPSASEPVHLYQIWLFPNARGLTPSYEERSFTPTEKHNRLQLVASEGGRESSLNINQDANVFLSSLDGGTRVTHALEANRYVWLQVMRGTVNAAGQELSAGDGLAASGPLQLVISAGDQAEVMLFDLA
jgi:redox-sensitive bicupin YhaK (pirin superfamily)